ncbi:MAG TPA: ATP-dependent helicase C-terminal domain-containing protein, partial [Bryobacteraceae bacterium]|nr:ATP-dependent helicase C-terminal domain-containing protein [Bryobacteraceae bacterium]
SPIEPEWLLDLFPDRVTERTSVEWNRKAERVEGASALLFGGLAMEEGRDGPVDADQAARLLAEKAVEAGVGRFAEPDDVAELTTRLAFAAEHSSVPPPAGDDVNLALVSLCNGLRSFAELKEAAGRGGLERALLSRLDARASRELREVAPEKIRLPGGRFVRVRYAAGRPPWISSRLQDFFGMRETPRVARGAVPLVVHLLAPNQRPVQTTSDLAGFWTRLYPQVRRELRRRYPRHSWPEYPVGGE